MEATIATQKAALFAVTVATTTAVISAVSCMVAGVVDAENDDENVARESGYLSYRPPLLYVPGTLNFTLAEDVFIREFCRFSKEEMLEILPLLGLENIKYRNRLSASPKTALTLLCARLSYPERLKMLMHHFGHSRTWLFVFNDVVIHLNRRYGTMLTWPKMHTFGNQCIVTPDGLVISTMGPYAGRMSDMAIFNRSNTQQYLQQLNQGKEFHQRLWIYGDPAYQGCWGTVGATRQYNGVPITPEERRFNRHMASWRIEVEHAFAIHANTWQLFTKKTIMKLNLSPVAAYYHTAILMSNIMNCLQGNQTSRRFGLAPPSVSEYLAEYNEPKDEGD